MKESSRLSKNASKLTPTIVKHAMLTLDVSSHHSTPGYGAHNAFHWA